jgi:heterodisulfide reductase subunit C
LLTVDNQRTDTTLITEGQSEDRHYIDNREQLEKDRHYIDNRGDNERRTDTTLLSPCYQCSVCPSLIVALLSM